MIIVRKKTTKQVYLVLADDTDISIDADGNITLDGGPVHDLTNMESVTGEMPTDMTYYGSGALSYDGTWAIYDQTIFDNLYAADEPKREEAAGVRKERNKRLSESDWVVTYHTEKGTNLPSEWKTYRQELRDITDQGGFPYSVNWPKNPEGATNE